jgi:hypothetical protein
MSELPDDLRELVHKARREEEPNDEDRRAVRRAIGAHCLAAGVAVSSATVVAHAGAAAKGSLLAGLATYTTIGFTVGAVSVGVLSAVTREPAPRAPAPSASAAPAVRATRTGAAVTTSSAPAPSALAPSPTSTPSARFPSPTPALSLEDEASGLAAVQRALRDGHPEQALRLVEAQQRSFKGGALDEERAAARVLALCDAGRRAEARQAAARFLTTHPSSPIAARVSARCLEK